MKRSMWSVAWSGLAFSGLALVGGTSIGGEFGPLLAAYGLLLGLAALYMIAALAIRDRTWRRLRRPLPPLTAPDRLAGRRIF
jgi:predicted membrane protein